MKTTEKRRVLTSRRNRRISSPPIAEQTVDVDRDSSLPPTNEAVEHWLFPPTPHTDRASSLSPLSPENGCSRPGSVCLSFPVTVFAACLSSYRIRGGEESPIWFVNVAFVDVLLEKVWERGNKGEDPHRIPDHRFSQCSLLIEFVLLRLDSSCQSQMVLFLHSTNEQRGWGGWGWDLLTCSLVFNFVFWRSSTIGAAGSLTFGSAVVVVQMGFVGESTSSTFSLAAWGCWRAERAFLRLSFLFNFTDSWPLADICKSKIEQSRSVDVERKTSMNEWITKKPFAWMNMSYVLLFFSLGDEKWRHVAARVDQGLIVEANRLKNSSWIFPTTVSRK